MNFLVLVWYLESGQLTIVPVLLRLIKKVSQNESYPHMNLYVSDFSLTDSTLVVLDPSVNFAVMFEHFGK